MSIDDDRRDSAAVLRIVGAVRDECAAMDPLPSWAEFCVRLVRATLREARRDPEALAELQSLAAKLDHISRRVPSGDTEAAGLWFAVGAQIGRLAELLGGAPADIASSACGLCGQPIRERGTACSPGCPANVGGRP